VARIKSAIKRARQNETRRIRNKAVKTEVKTEIKKVLTAVAARDQETSQNVLREATSTISKAAAKGVIHKRAAARKISRLAKKVTALKLASR